VITIKKEVLRGRPSGGIFILRGRTMVTLTKCSECGYPIEAKFEGETVICAYCGEKLEAVVTQGITIPTTLFWGILAFGLGVLVGPALIASTSEGRSWLEKQARGIGR